MLPDCPKNHEFYYQIWYAFSNCSSVYLSLSSPLALKMYIIFFYINYGKLCLLIFVIQQHQKWDEITFSWDPDLIIIWDKLAVILIKLLCSPEFLMYSFSENWKQRESNKNCFYCSCYIVIVSVSFQKNVAAYQYKCLLHCIN